MRNAVQGLSASLPIPVSPKRTTVARLHLADDAGAAGRPGCERCASSGVCLPADLAGAHREAFAALISQHKRLRASQALFRAGEVFHHLYIVKAGAFKTMVLLGDGREQVTGFHFAGDVLGVDAISSPAHPSDAIALEDSSVCAVPFAQLARLSQGVEPLQTYLQQLLAREVVHDQGLMLLLGRMLADERVAAFLLNVSRRFKARGYAPLAFTLPMAREDIGNYLGLTLETVSRCFSRLKSAGIISVECRQIRILNLPALQRMVGSGDRVREGAHGGGGGA